MRTTQEKMQSLLNAATAVAIAVPVKPRAHQIEYHIPRDEIDWLRRTLEDVGIDWRAMQVKVRAARKGAR